MVYTIVVHLVAKDDADCISKLSAKLVEASQVYSKDKETLSWFVMQDTADKRKFCIVERYVQESVSFGLFFFTFPHLFFYGSWIIGADAMVVVVVVVWDDTTTNSTPHHPTYLPTYLLKPSPHPPPRATNSINNTEFQTY